MMTNKSVRQPREGRASDFVYLDSAYDAGQGRQLSCPLAGWHKKRITFLFWRRF